MPGVGYDELELAHVHVQLFARDHTAAPVSDPVPCLMPPVRIVAVLSAWIWIHESIWNWSTAVTRVRVDLGGACLAGQRRHQRG